MNKDEQSLNHIENAQNPCEKVEEEKAKTKEELVKQAKDKAKKQAYLWVIKITLVAFFLSVVFSVLAELTISANSIALFVILILLLIVLSIITDCIGVAVTSCDLAPITALASKKIKGGKMAMLLLKNAEKVSSICNDVIGDICGIISGASAGALVLFFVTTYALADMPKMIITIALSAVIAAATIGGKAYFKIIAMKKSKQIVMLTAKFLCIFANENKLSKSKPNKERSKKKDTK